MRLRGFVGLAFFLFLGSLCAQNITNTGEIYGRVVDEGHRPLPGVIVTLESDILASQTTETSSNGSYRFLNLPPGTYTSTFTQDGFTTVRQEEIRVSIGHHVELNINMKHALQETVSVSAQSNILDRK